MKARFLLVVSSMFFGGHAFADYSSHQFHYMEMELSQCKQIASAAAEKVGFSNVQSQEFSYGADGRKYVIVYGINKDGYSFQYTCEPVKGFGYLIINGAKVDVKNKIRDEIGDGIRKAVNKAK